jgi:hypothetical protein
MQVAEDLDERFLGRVFGVRFVPQQHKKHDKNGTFDGANEVVEELFFPSQNAGDECQSCVWTDRIRVRLHHHSYTITCFDPRSTSRAAQRNPEIEPAGRKLFGFAQAGTTTSVTVLKL